MHRTLLTTPILSWIVRILARGIVRLIGWRWSGEVPDLKKYVLVASPHTSNWDGILLVLFGAIKGLNIFFLGKKELFPWPFTSVMRFFCGIPVDRKQRTNLVARLSEAFQENESMILVVPPSGTRSFRPHWKSGFYHMAHQAGVPLVLGFLDYKTREAGFGPVIWPTGDKEADLIPIREFYETKTGRFPEKTSTIVFEDKKAAV